MKPELHDRLNQALVIGQRTIHKRLVMAPMTRSRADAGGVPGDIVATYYAQRASAGMIVSSDDEKVPRAWVTSSGESADPMAAVGDIVLVGDELGVRITEIIEPV